MRSMPQPLASVSGMTGGSPNARKKPEKDLEKALHEQQQALHQSGRLLDDLADSPGVLLLAQEVEARINEFLKTDEPCRALLKVIAGWRNIIEIGPRIAEEKVRKLLGPQLTAVKEETSAAP